MVTISKEEYIGLLKAEEKLNRLERGGVDNWEWYGEALNPEGEDDLDTAYISITEGVMNG